MDTLLVMIGTEIMADGAFRTGGKIHRLSAATAQYLITIGKARVPTDEEVTRMGVEGETVTRRRDKP